MRRIYTTSGDRAEKAVLVQAVFHGQSRELAAESLEELERLADTAGAKVVGTIRQHRDRPTAGFFIGEGKLADIQMACRQFGANLVIFDNELTPIQVNNLDLSLGVKVIDRTELILQIFALRARSAESKIQVELAQLQYLISRIPASERQHRFSGGIGMRGPGESPFQLRNAPMRRRISDLKKKLADIQAHRERTAHKRTWPVVCLVGYTNVGKSTLLNALAAGDAYVDDRLFATLDTKTRLLRPARGAKALLVDTVGFVRNLPHGIIASFRSTMQVAADADLLLVVCDAGHQYCGDQLDVVRNTLREIGAGGVPSLLILNKCDTASAKERLAGLMAVSPDAVCVSARTGEGLETLKGKVHDALSRSDTDR